MKNLFEKKDNTGIIIIMAAAAVTAGTLAYLYFTENDHEARKSLKHKLKDEAKNMASGFISKKTGISKRTVKKVADYISK